MKINIKKNYKIIYPSNESNWLTNYNNDDNIIYYYSSKCIYTTLDYDVENKFKEISNEEHEKLSQEKTLNY